ncbi:MAG: magnesium protoporphyrin IX methyltransferase [Pseudomonadota bacterium]
MTSATYQKRKDELEAYFDRTASAAWARLTSDAPVSGIRATVRAGRDAMRETLLSWLPEDLTGRRILDAGCGAGQLAIEAARRGADVVAVDLSQTLVNLAAERSEALTLPGSIQFRVGDMFNPGDSTFDHVVAMDSLIHYNLDDFEDGVRKLASFADNTVLFTFAPRTPLLSAMHAAGKLFPRSDRSPAICPHTAKEIGDRFTDRALLRSKRIKSGFYISMALEMAG